MPDCGTHLHPQSREEEGQDSANPSLESLRTPAAGVCLGSQSHYNAWQVLAGTQGLDGVPRLSCVCGQVRHPWDSREWAPWDRLRGQSGCQ